MPTWHGGSASLAFVAPLNAIFHFAAIRRVKVRESEASPPPPSPWQSSGEVGASIRGSIDALEYP